MRCVDSEAHGNMPFTLLRCTRSPYFSCNILITSCWLQVAPSVFQVEGIGCRVVSNVEKHTENQQSLERVNTVQKNAGSSNATRRLGICYVHHMVSDYAKHKHFAHSFRHVHLADSTRHMPRSTHTAARTLPHVCHGTRIT